MSHNLEMALEHYAYEWECLNFALSLLSNASSQQAVNVGINAMCLHSRNLMDFYLPAGKLRCDDMAASKCVREWSVPAFPQGLRDRINKQIHHLTYSRGSNKITVGDLLELYRELDTARLKFAEAMRSAET